MKAAAGRLALAVLAALGGIAGGLRAQTADLILLNGKVVTVDARDSIQEAVAIAGERLLRVGTKAEALSTRGPSTRVVDLGGRTVLPGLIDSHTHPSGACMTEFDHPVPDMQSLEDVLEYLGSRAKAIPKGEWIQVRQVFITRLKEQRYPTRAELDRAAPDHPVIFSTGPDASLSSLALKRSGIDRDFKITDGGPGAVERDPATGEPTGILRSCTRLVKYEEPSSRKRPSEEDQVARLRELFRDYNSVGLTSIADRDAGGEAIERYERLLARGELTVRIACSRHLDTAGPVEKVEAEVRRIAEHPLRKGGPMLRVIGVKTFLDGGMLTGSAYLREPWGKSKIYSIEDPSYRGMLLIPREKLFPVVRATLEAGLQFTAHSVGDGAVHLLLEAYEEAARARPIRSARPSLTHANFLSREAVEAMARLGVVADIQPAWLWLDARTLAAHFGLDRLRYFQPLKT
ncbi:MAG: amidohydrolase, partial [Thermoanaerobaculia bacterium]